MSDIRYDDDEPVSQHQVERDKINEAIPRRSYLCTDPACDIKLPGHSHYAPPVAAGNRPEDSAGVSDEVKAVRLRYHELVHQAVHPEPPPEYNQRWSTCVRCGALTRNILCALCTATKRDVGESDPEEDMARAERALDDSMGK